MRLGPYPCRAAPTAARPTRPTAADVGPRAAPAPLRVQQRLPRAVRASTGWSLSGTSPDGQLVEIIELPDHPWFLAVQCHPEFKSKPTKAHPLFRDFVAAGLTHRAEKKADPGRSRGHALAGAS